MEAFWASIDVPAVGGWVLLAGFLSLVFRAIVKGDLLTRREADAKDAEALRLRGTNDHLMEQNDRSLKALEAMNDNFTAIRRAAEKRSP